MCVCSAAKCISYVTACSMLFCFVFTHVAWGWGDPHITTTDGRRYTFNGLGEYVLLRTNHSSGFEFQGRTAPAANSNATIFSVFALRESSEKIEVMYIAIRM